MGLCASGCVGAGFVSNGVSGDIEAALEVGVQLLGKA